MAHVHSFPAATAPSARVLVLGSMPGRASLEAQQYYAHPRNAFWRIMGALFAANPELPYPQRLEKLRSAGVAVWDVLASCTRESSLDSDIDEESIAPNDFASFFDAHPLIERVFFNGAKAEHSYRRYVLPELQRRELQAAQLQLARLPSTSPAHASLRFEQKLEAWGIVAKGLASTP